MCSGVRGFKSCGEDLGYLEVKKVGKRGTEHILDGSTPSSCAYCKERYIRRGVPNTVCRKACINSTWPNSRRIR